MAFVRIIVVDPSGRSDPSDPASDLLVFQVPASIPKEGPIYGRHLVFFEGLLKNAGIDYVVIDSPRKPKE